MKVKYHKEMAAGRRYELSLVQQMGNIGSEVYRTFQAKQRYPERFEQAADRMLELFDLTLSDNHRTLPQRKEIARMREGICSYLRGENEYGLDTDFLNAYFLAFGIAANRK